MEVSSPAWPCSTSRPTGLGLRGRAPAWPGPGMGQDRGRVLELPV